MQETQTQVLIVGGGMGGVAAALAALRNGASVVLAEPTDWLGGQLTAALCPPDDHRRIEQTGASRAYLGFREAIRNWYRKNLPLTDAARDDPRLNPGAGWASPLCAEPRAALAVIDEMLTPYRADGRLRLLTEHTPVAVHTTGDRVEAVTLLSTRDGAELTVHARYVLDATEVGDLLDLGGVEHVTGKESRAETGEPSAADAADPLDMQSATWCFAVEHREGEDHTIDRPAAYDHFRDWRPPAWQGRPILGYLGPAEADIPPRPYRLTVNPDDDPQAIDVDHRNLPHSLELWTYRRVRCRRQFRPGTYDSDVTVVNWPMNDYTGGPIFGTPDAAFHQERARQLSLSLLYWLQTEAPRPDGGTGWPGLRLCPDVTGTADGLAKIPYVRESRRIRAVTTIVEQDVSIAVLGDHDARRYPDSVGVGHYYWIDRHTTTRGGIVSGGLPQPFEIPLGALLPVRVTNLLAAAKNIGTTHVTNGCYRMHPVEWACGEAAGALAAHCLATGGTPHQVQANPEAFQQRLTADGFQLRWPEGTRW